MLINLIPASALLSSKVVRIMIYKFYKERILAGKRPDDQEYEQMTKGFQEIYDRYGVKVIGAWENIEDPDEGYLITAYRDNAHYEETVAKMRVDPQYIELTKDLQESRESIESVTLKVTPGFPEA